MTRIQRFEDLIAWQKSRELAKSIYRATQNGKFSNDFGLIKQLQRGAVSVMSNIAEGFERGGPAEFHQFLFIAKASCAEVRSQLYLALDIGYLAPHEFDPLMKQAEEVARILGGLRRAVKLSKPS